MKTIKMGDVPVEFFTGLGELRKHDRACNNITRKEAMQLKPKEHISFERQVILAKRKERKHQAYLESIGMGKTYAPAQGKNVSTKDLLTTVGKKTKLH